MPFKSIFVALALLAPAVHAQTPPSTATQSPFTFEETMLPMRDGTRLQTVILRPRDANGSLPVLLQRTPYGVPDSAPAAMPKSWAALAKDGYIFVFQSMRGRFKSDGVFTLSTAVHPGDKKAIDEATDAYDTVAWAAKLRGSSGKVGMWGISYPGFAAAVALVGPHPALKAVSPQAAWTDYWTGDDLHRNGALRLSYATDWLYMLQHDKADDATFDYGQYDTYDWFLRTGSVENVDKTRFKGSIPMFTALLDHPNHDAFYTRQRWVDALGRTTVPTLNVAGYWDQEDPSGSWAVYRKQEANDPNHLNVIVAGPWSHGYWSRPEADNLGRIPYGVPSGQQFLDEVQAPFFAWWLHGKGAKPAYEVKSFQSGSWGWKSYAQWPPAAAKPTSLYLGVDGTLSFDKPTGQGCRDYVSDPANPVPFRPRPISPTYPRPEWQWWEAEDQRFVEGRPDVLTWKTAVLTEDVTVTGTVAAELMASTSGTDSDFVVKLIDVFPDDYEPAPDHPQNGDYTRSLNGYELPVAMEVRRGRFLTSDTAPSALTSGKITAWTIPMRDHDHLFRKGHRIMVQVQSTWFPVIDRNPQTFVPNIARAKAGDFVKATQKVCAGSRLMLPVVR
ncbi:CocE/NonD family hydrolase [Sphingomonas sp.]|uniref:CocE/NonD family hydrolase n=1 Tax=Sphingomonas sp. TaxID=28214 RepID=UPI0035BBFF9A